MYKVYHLSVSPDVEIYLNNDVKRRVVGEFYLKPITVIGGHHVARYGLTHLLYCLLDGNFVSSRDGICKLADVDCYSGVITLSGNCVDVKSGSEHSFTINLSVNRYNELIRVLSCYVDNELVYEDMSKLDGISKCSDLLYAITHRFRVLYLPSIWFIMLYIAQDTHIVRLLKHNIDSSETPFRQYFKHMIDTLYHLCNIASKRIDDISMIYSTIDEIVNEIATKYRVTNEDVARGRFHIPPLAFYNFEEFLIALHGAMAGTYSDSSFNIIYSRYSRFPYPPYMALPFLTHVLVLARVAAYDEPILLIIDDPDLTLNKVEKEFLASLVTHLVTDSLASAVHSGDSNPLYVVLNTGDVGLVEAFRELGKHVIMELVMCSREGDKIVLRSIR